MSVNTKDSHDRCRTSRVLRPAFPVESRVFLAPRTKFRSHLSSIHKKRRPSDIRGEIGSKKHHGVGNLIRFTTASQRDLLKVAGQEVSICKMRCGQARPYQAGTYGVNAYAIGTELVGCGV